MIPSTIGRGGFPQQPRTFYTKAYDEFDLVDRAIAAYRRFGALQGNYGGYTREIDGRLYVVVHKHGACHAAYRLRGDGRLRRIWRWPDVIW